jgi:hypothetical protein
MQLTINRNMCGHHPAACEQCFGEFLRRGSVPDRGCFTDIIDDGRPEITAIIRSGPYFGTLVVTEENREEIIYDGWMKYVQLPPEAFDIVPPHGEEVRRMLKEAEDSHQ